MRDGPPSPAYVVEWVGSLQVDLISGGTLNVNKEVLEKVQGLKKSYLKFYCTFANLLAPQRDYTIAVYMYKYMLTLGVMEKGDFICVNQDQHSSYECFDTEVLMRDHWLTCLKIPQSDGYATLVFTKEPARRMKLPLTMKGHRGRARTEPIVAIIANQIS